MFVQHWVVFMPQQSRIYGIRRYEEGSTCDSHLDQVETHVISVIMNIDQKVDKVGIFDFLLCVVAQSHDFKGD